MDQTPYLEYERELASLMYPDFTISFHKGKKRWRKIDPAGKVQPEEIPAWTRSNYAAFSLMQQEKCYPTRIVGGLSVEDVYCERRLVVEHFEDYGGDHDLTARVVIVRGCIELRKDRNQRLGEINEK